MANIITGCRILISIGLLFCPTFSLSFYALYLLGGLSDIIDGAVARNTNTESEFGSKLDSIADIIFVVICMIKIMPVIFIDNWLYVWTAIIVLIKVFNLVYGYIRNKRFIFIHSMMNKMTGFLIFVMPLTILVISPMLTAIPVCIVATVAAIQEGYYIIKVKDVE